MNGTYNTRQKKLIEGFLKENLSSQYTCDEISEMLKQKGTPVGKTTVYRCVERLTHEGKVRKIVGVASKSAQYQYIDEEMNCSGHMHLKCLNCGEFIHLGCDFLDGVNEHIYIHHRFKIDNSKSVLYGLCDKCSDSIQE
ncbi:MAG: transcriptional repressor [Clostridia bacterium]|nr:transcriptional repressor [Clostridia bacterium]